MTYIGNEDDAQVGSHAGGNGSGLPSARKPLILQYWQAAVRHIRIISVILALALFAGLVLTLLATPQYSATSQIEISRQQANVTNVEGLEREQSGPDLEFYATQYQLLESRALAERVSRRLRLARSEEFFAAHGETPAGEGLIGGGPPTAEDIEERQRQVVLLLQEHVEISPIRGSALINVSYVSGSPELSARIANSWVQEFIQQTMDRRLASTADARLFLEQRLDTERRRLQDSERELISYAADQGIIRMQETESADGRTRTTQTLASADVAALNAALAEATAERVRAEGLARAARQRGSGPAIENNMALSNLRARRAEIAAELSRLLVRFEPEYPDAQALRDQLRSIDAGIAAEEGRDRAATLRAIDTAFEAAQQREVALRARVDTLLARLVAENRAGVQYNIFQREVDTNRQLYDALLQRYREIGVAGVGANNISVVDEAATPTKPSSPVLLLNLAFALLAGLGLATVAVFILENLDESVREPQQLQDRLDVPLLGAIPYDASEDRGETMDIIADPKSQLAEAYMTVRTNLAFTTDHGVPRSICVTSTSPAEGKSTTSYALTQVLRRTGKRVVLIDADMRRPRMAEMLGLDNGRGLSNYLAGDAEIGSLIQQASAQQIAFIAAGPTPPSAAELLSNERTLLLVETLLGQFDHVVIDCPPMLGLSDGPLIARCVEGVVYVVESQRTSVRAAAASLTRLREARARIFGAVLTKYRAKGDGYGYGYGYGYGQASGNEAER